MGPRRRSLGLHREARQLHRLPLSLHRHDAFLWYSRPLRNWFPDPRRQDLRRHRRLPLLGRVLSQWGGLGARRCLRSLEKSLQARLFLWRARRKPRFLHLRTRHPPLSRTKRRSAQLFHLSLRGDQWPTGEKPANALFLPRCCRNTAGGGPLSSRRNSVLDSGAGIGQNQFKLRADTLWMPLPAVVATFASF